MTDLSFQWTKLSTHPDPTNGHPLPRSSHGLSLSPNNNHLYLIGGENIPRTPLPPAQFTWKLNLQTNEWKCIVSHSSPPSRVAHAQAYHNDKIYIFGGRTGIDMQETAMNDFWCFDISTETWSEVKASNEPPPGRSFHKMICFRDNLYVFGGCGSSGRLADLYRFDIQQQRWDCLGTSKLRGRGGANVIALPAQNSLLVLAGFAGEETNDGQLFDLTSEEWSSEDVMTFETLRPRSVCVSATLASFNKVLIFGGEVDPSHKGHDGAGGFEGDLVVLDVDTKKIEMTIPWKPSTWPEKRGWADSDLLETEEKSSLFLFGGLMGDDENPTRLGDLWRCDVTKMAT